MTQWLVMPLVIPALAASMLLLVAQRSVSLHRSIGLASTVLVALIAARFLWHLAAGGMPIASSVGDWPAPFGIALVVDRLSALFLVLTGVVAALALAHAMHDGDRQGRGSAWFHAMFQLQLLGLNGAFLAGDVFNLFVFFEVLLIASIGLLAHGGGPDRARFTMRYVVVNLVGSTLLLVGVALLYGSAGTLNMADLAARLPQLEPLPLRLAHCATALLFVGFGIKAAVFPLCFWLPGSYAAAAAPVAALFAIMTKVGIYALIRVLVLVFGHSPPPIAGGLLWIGLATVTLGACGVLASRDLGRFNAFLTITSVGLIVTGVGTLTPAGANAALFYLVQSTLVIAALFLLRERVAAERGEITDRFLRAPAPAARAIVPALYWVLAAAAVGMPPLTGFFGKLMLLESTASMPAFPAVWAIVLGSSLILTFAAAIAGSQLFWHTRPAQAAPSPPQPASPLLPATIAVVLQFALMIGAEPLRAYTEQTAIDLYNGTGYREAVFAAGRSSMPAASATKTAGVIE